MDPAIPDLPEQLWGLVAQVPAGRVTTYGDLAQALGNPVAARWIGHVLLHHEHGPACPCHRVVRSDGQLGFYAAGSPQDKARRLAAEGVTFSGEVVDLPRCRFPLAVGERPLEILKQAQEKLARQVVCRGKRRVPRWLGGVDVSYPSPEEGIAAYSLVDTTDGRLLWHTTLRRRTRFPYISSYLTFRELPIHLDLLAEVRAAGRLAELVLVDGTGILHPRRAGIASALGVAAGVPTIGVIKKLLCGRVDLEGIQPLESRPVRDGEQRIGMAIRPTASRHVIYFSPGHRIGMAAAEAAVRSVLLGRQLPEPLYWADRLSRAAGRAHD